MSKLSFAVASLVVVVPAAFMMYLLVMGFIAGMPMMLMVAAGLAMLCGVGVALLPVLSFIIGPKARKAPKAAAPAKTDEAVEDFEDFGDEAVDEDFEDISAEDDFGEEMDTFDDVDLAGEDDWDDFGDDEFKDD